MEQPDPLASMPFSFSTRNDGSIVISYHTAPVMILRGRSAERFTARIADADAPPHSSLWRAPPARSSMATSASGSDRRDERL